MNLEKITMVKLEDCKEKIDWRANLYDECVYLFMCDNKVIAEAVLFDRCKHIVIDNIEARYKHKGIGTHVVKLISDYAREKGKEGISGESVREALDFWNSLYAEFKFKEDDPCMECFDCNCDECGDYDSDELTPFTIKSAEVDRAFDRHLRLHS